MPASNHNAEIRHAVRKGLKHNVKLRFNLHLRTSSLLISRAFSKWAPWLFIGVILILVFYGIGDIRVLAAKSKADATLTAAELKDKIEDLKWILELILAASGLFTIAQGIAAGFSARSFADEAKGMLAEIKGQFPVFKLLEERRQEAVANLPNLDQAFAKISSYGLGNRAYGNLPFKLRQELLSAETFLPYRFMGRDDPPEVFALNLKRLAQFYSAKFTYEQKLGSGSLEDLEYARYLLSLAIRKAGSKFYLLNELGNVHMVHFKVLSTLPGPCLKSGRSELRDALSLARGCFDDSIIVQRQQLRAYYNLAYIEADLAPELTPEEAPDRSLNLAVAHLREGLKFGEWEQTENHEFTCNALYNLACYHARLFTCFSLILNAPMAAEHEKETVTALHKAAKLGLIDPEYVCVDFTRENGDFSTLIRNGLPETKATLTKVRAELSHHYRMAERQ